jgi:hypothetical protein
MERQGDVVGSDGITQHRQRARAPWIAAGGCGFRPMLEK